MKLAALLGFGLSFAALSQPPVFRFALTGDSILNRKLSVHKDPAYIAMFDAIRGADARFTNLETLIHQYESAGASVSGGAYMTSPPWLPEELQWAGFNLFAVANNHTFDFGAEGMRSTLRALDAANMVHAGAGENLALARAPGYLDTGNGRVALVACASTFTPGSLAGEQRPDLRGRPGLSPLRFSTVYTVEQPAFEGLRKLAQLATPAATQASGQVRLAGNVYEMGGAAAIRTEPEKDDLEGIVRSVKDARRQADWVVVSIHAHEGKPGNRELPADFLATFAHAVIDAGADIFVAHGPHVLRPLEIYKGKPIFYSLANFVFENETMAFQPAESYLGQGLPAHSTPADYYDARSKNDTRGFPADPPIWESVVAEVAFMPNGTLQSIRLRPISLGFREPRSQRGRPRPASAEHGRKIIDHLAALSAPLGTTIRFENGLGVVETGKGAR